MIEEIDSPTAQDNSDARSNEEVAKSPITVKSYDDFNKAVLALQKERLLFFSH